MYAGNKKNLLIIYTKGEKMFVMIKSLISSSLGFVLTKIMELFGTPPMFDYDYGMTFDAIIAAIKTMLFS